MSFSRGSSRPRDWTMKLMLDLRATLSSLTQPVTAPSSERSKGTTSGAQWLWGGQAGDPKQAAQPSCPCWSPPLPPCYGHRHKPLRSSMSSGLGGMSALPTHRAQTWGDGSGTHAAGDPQPRPPPPCDRGAGAVCRLQPPGPHVRAQ